MKRIFFSGFLFFLTAVTGCFHRSEPVGSRAPDFTLTTLRDKNQKVTLSEVNAQSPVLLVFWASWCPVCVEEIPVLNQWQKKYAAAGLKILGVNVEEPRSIVEQFVKTTPIHYPVLLDEDGQAADRYGLAGIPVAIFLEKGQKILYYSVSLPANLDALLAQRRN